MNYIARRQSFAGFLLMIVFSLLLAGCGGGGGGGSKTTTVLKAIVLEPDSATVPVGGERQFTAVGKDQNGKTMSITPTWSVTGDIGTVDPESGATTTFKAVDEADTDINGTIRATVGDISGSAQITVSTEPPVLTTIEIEPDEITFQVNTSQEFTATGYDQFSNALTINPAWSGTGVAESFSATGSTVSFTPTATGSGTITASEGYVSGTANITITEAAPATIRVGVDKDYTTIQAAIDAATDGATIIVDQGTYTENLTIDKSITLKSTNPGSASVVANTSINGGGSGTVWVTRLSGNEPAVNIEGFTITGGNMGVSVSNSNTQLSVSLKKNVICGNQGYSGVSVVENDLQLILEGNTIENNSAESEGGGIRLYGNWDNKMQVTMTNNIIRNNSAGEWGGGIYASCVEGTWSGNTIDENSSDNWGGGIFLDDSSPVIDDNEITNNEVLGEYGNAGGIYIDENSSPIIQNNTINGNTVIKDGGGLYIKSPGLTLTGNTISNNSAAFGGGIMAGADTALVNNIISGNTASGNGGGLGVASGVGVVNISGNEFTDNISPQGGGVYVSRNGGELTGSDNIFNNNEQYAIYLHYTGATWTGDGNTFSGNTPSDVGP